MDIGKALLAAQIGWVGCENYVSVLHSEVTRNAKLRLGNDGVARMFEELNWDDERLEHIAAHGVTIGEVLEVLERAFWSPKWTGDKRRVYGQTESGRYLFIVVGRRRSGGLWLVTARDMTAGERHLFLKKGRGAKR